MLKKSLSALILTILVMHFCYSQEEKISITTYYPSPYGSYSELRSKRLAVGENYISGDYCWGAGCGSNVIHDDADLVVEGRVGIGTQVPLAPLTVFSQYPDSYPVNSIVQKSMTALFQAQGDRNNPQDAAGLAFYLYPDSYSGEGGDYMKDTAMIYAPGLPTTPYRTKNLQLAAVNDKGVIRFHTGGYAAAHTERVRIESNGNVGIGTTQPNSMLDVSGGIKVGYDSGDYPSKDAAQKDETRCLASKAGTMRYNSYGMEYCSNSEKYPNKYEWQRLGGIKEETSLTFTALSTPQDFPAYPYYRIYSRAKTTTPTKTGGFLIGYIQRRESTNVSAVLLGIVDGKIMGAAEVSTQANYTHPGQANSFTIPVRKGQNYEIIMLRNVWNFPYFSEPVFSAYWVPIGD